MAISTLRELFVHQLRDLYNAEKQITRAMPKLIKASSSPELQNALKMHLEQTNHQIERLDQVFEQLEISQGRVKCHGMEGVIEEGQEVIDDVDREVRDAGIIAAAQKVEHYEISSYGTARTWAELLGEHEVAGLLQETLDEEKETDQKLNQLAQTINAQVEEEDEEEEGEGGETEISKVNRSRGKAAKGR